MSLFKTNHKFSDITSWSHELNSWAQNFKARHHVFPNILIASSETYNRIDMVANSNGQEKIRNPEGKPAVAFVSMSGFRGQDYELAFCIDDQLDRDRVKLIFDSDPGGDGEPIEEEFESDKAMVR